MDIRNEIGYPLTDLYYILEDDGLHGGSIKTLRGLRFCSQVFLRKGQTVGVTSQDGRVVGLSRL